MKKIVTTGILIISLIFSSQVVKAQRELKEADEQYNLFNYSKAVDLYSQAYREKGSLYIAERLANCYRFMHDYKKTESWYAIAIGWPGSAAINTLYYAQALQNNSKYSEAKERYQAYATLNKNVTEAELTLWVSSCDSSMRWMRHPTEITIQNEQGLNTPQSDWGAVQYRKHVIFTSDRPNKVAEDKTASNKPFLKFDGDKLPDTKTYGWTGNDYLRLYQASITAKGTDSLKLFPVTAPTEYHVGAAAFSPDGNEMYFTLTKLPENYNGPKSVIKTINLEIYFSKKNPATGKWGAPVSFRYNNVDKYSVGDPYVSPDGSCLYFVSDMPGGKGGTDIYYCLKDMKGNWDQPVNLKAINTSGNERTPIVDADNNLYFSSDGGVGMGGLDIYKAERTGLNSVGHIHNMAYPLNSPQDDFAFNLSTNISGYFASNRLGGAGSDDIYSYSDKLFANFKVEGRAYDRDTRKPLIDAIITLQKVNGMELKVQTDSTGTYKFKLEDNSEYDLVAEKTNYRSNHQKISTIGATRSVIKDIYLEKIELNKAIKIENIYYDFDKSNIRPDAAVELDKLIKILEDNPTIWIEIGSHTDSRGNDAYNLALSQRRANAVIKYIIQVGGIDKNRVTGHGYGETRLLNRCGNGVKCSVEENQINRRTEFTIVKQ